MIILQYHNHYKHDTSFCGRKETDAQTQTVSGLKETQVAPSHTALRALTLPRPPSPPLPFSEELYTLDTFSDRSSAWCVKFPHLFLLFSRVIGKKGRPTVRGEGGGSPEEGVKAKEIQYLFEFFLPFFPPVFP